MKTDRELLELAAKAAGYRYKWDGRGMLIDNRKNGTPVYWDPRKYDGQAFRLATRLGIDLLFSPEDVEAVASQHERQVDQVMISPWACESWVLKRPLTPESATRRAIFRCAVEVGKAMPCE